MTDIVVGIDSSKDARATVLEAAGMALNMGARLHVVAGYVQVRPTRRQREGAPRDIAHCFGPRGEVGEVLGEIERVVAERGVAVRTWSGVETPSRMMRRVARAVSADFVVCGPELGRINQRRALWRRRPRHTLAERVAQRATWRVLDLTVPHRAATTAVEPVVEQADRTPEVAAASGPVG